MFHPTRGKPLSGTAFSSILVAVSLALATCSNPSVPAPTPLLESQASTAGTPSRGEALYAANCQICHGDQEGTGATGSVPLHNENGHTWHHPDVQLEEWIMNGKSGFSQMPAFRDKLDESEVDAILGYIKTWWTEDQQASQAGISQRYLQALDQQKQG